MAERSDNPYRKQPSRAFWSRSVTRGWRPETLVEGEPPLLRADDRIASAGSCFAANIVPFLEAAGFEYVRTEVDEADTQYGYALYSAAYGNIYTPRQLHQLLARVLGRFRPAEDRWHVDGTVIDPFRPGLPDPAADDEEFDLITRSHLDRVRDAVAEATVFVFTLGLTEAWVSAIDGAVYPACPGTIAGHFDADRHLFRNFGVAETTADLAAAIGLLREINPKLRVVLTVSPVPLVATATGWHVWWATTFSKSVLRVACEEIAATTADVRYFPAYEIVTAPWAEGFFAADRRNVSPAGIRTVMDVLLGHSETPAPRAAGPNPTERMEKAATLSRILAERECEEVAADADLQR